MSYHPAGTTLGNLPSTYDFRSTEDPLRKIYGKYDTVPDQWQSGQTNTSWSNLATPNSFGGRIDPGQQMNASMKNVVPPTWQSKYMNKDMLGGIGSAMEGLGSLATGWAALKNLKLSRQAMENQQNQWSTNYEAQRLATNNAIANQNAWKQAQGRTDYGSYVGGKPSGTTYVG